MMKHLGSYVVYIYLKNNPKSRQCDTYVYSIDTNNLELNKTLESDCLKLFVCDILPQVSLTVKIRTILYNIKFERVYTGLGLFIMFKS